MYADNTRRTYTIEWCARMVRAHTVGERYDGDRRILNAVDAAIGEGLWRSQTGAGITWVRSTPVTYRAGGKQYVVLTTTMGIIAFALP